MAIPELQVSIKNNLERKGEIESWAFFVSAVYSQEQCGIQSGVRIINDPSEWSGHGDVPLSIYLMPTEISLLRKIRDGVMKI